jgi:hypothetical protein
MFYDGLVWHMEEESQERKEFRRNAALIAHDPFITYVDSRRDCGGNCGTYRLYLRIGDRNPGFSKSWPPEPKSPKKKKKTPQ